MKYRLRRDQRQSHRHGSCADKYNAQVINSWCSRFFCFNKSSFNIRLTNVYFSSSSKWMSDFVIRGRSQSNKQGKGFLEHLAILCRAADWAIVASQSLRKSGFYSRSVFVGLVVDKVAFLQDLVRVLQFSPIRTIATIPHHRVTCICHPRHISQQLTAS